MLTNFPSPVLNVAVDVLKDLDGTDALAGLCFLFSKCQSSLNEGKRLENISWRLWSQKMTGRSFKYRPLTPDSPSQDSAAPVSGPLSSTSQPFSLQPQSFSSPLRDPIGRIILDILPNSIQVPRPLHSKLHLPLGNAGGTKVNFEVKSSDSSFLPTPATELVSISIIPPVLRIDGDASATSSSGSKLVSPTIGSPPHPVQSNVSSGSNTPASFPLVVVVNPTPNPTPHPTPPATPILSAMVTMNTDALAHTHVQLPATPRTLPSSLSSRRPALDLALQGRSSAYPSPTGSRSPTTSLLPPSPTANTSGSVTSTSALSASSTNSNLSHLTTSSSTSVHSNDPRSLNANLNPHDARVFYLKRGYDELSSSSSEERSPVRPGIYPIGYADGSGQIRNPSAGGYSTANTNTAAIGSHLSRISRQISDGQGSTSASGSAGRSWGESDHSDGRCHTAKNSKSSHASSTSDGKSRSRSRGRAHDGLMMASRKRAHAVGRKGARLGGVVHANVSGISQAHEQQGTQGQVRGSRNSSQAPSGPSEVQNFDQRPQTSVQQTRHPVDPYPRLAAQDPPQSMTMAPGKRPMFNLGSQSPNSPSDTDLSTSLRAKNAKSPASKASSPPPKMQPQGHLPQHRSAAAAPLPPPPPPPPGPIAGLPRASGNLSAAEAVIQAPRTKKVVLADDDDDDDWDETETELESDFEDDRKSDIDAEKGGTTVEAGSAGDNEDDGDWVSEDESGLRQAVVAPSKKSAPPTSGSGLRESAKRPDLSRHRSQPNIPTTVTSPKRKQHQPPEPQQLQEQVRPPPTQRPHHPAAPSRSSRRSPREQQHALQQKLQDAALEAQRQRELFTKIPKRSYSGHLARTKSGLSELMNPDPEIFPDNHPYKRNYSDGGRIGGLARMGLQPMTNVSTNGTGPGDISASSSRRPPSIGGSGLSFSMTSPLRPTKSAVALPVTDSVTASSYLGKSSGLGEKLQGKQREQFKGESNGSGPSAGHSRNPTSPIYRPKGRPRGTVMEDESEDEPEHDLQISHSAAQEKIAALFSGSKGKARAAPPPAPYPDPVPPPQPMRAQSQHVGIPPSNAAPLLGFPYNLPPAAPPSSPRTTRQLMLRKEIPEDLRQNLLWSRKINKQEFSGPRRSSSTALNMGLQPLTTIPAVVQLTAKRRSEPGETSGEPSRDPELEEDDLDPDRILRPGRMQRNRSWAGGGR